MPSYQVEVHGRNFLVDVEGEVAKRGFFSHRVVEAAGPEEAELAAVQAVRRTQRLRDVVKNSSDDPPTMEVTRMREVDPAAPRADLETGFIWYDESPKRWWQFWKR
jgi:hypothetical protein